MAVSGMKKNYSYLFGILMILMYFIGLLLINRGLGFTNVIVIVCSMVIYYVANVYNMAGRYRLRDIVIIVGINFILVMITTFLRIFILNEAIILFGLLTMFQIIYRYIIMIGLAEKQKIVFVGQNGYTRDLLESIKKDRQYKLSDFLKEEKNMDILTEKLLNLCENKKVDIIVDFTSNLLYDTKLVDKLLQYKLGGIQYYNYLEFYEIYENKLPVSNLSPKWFLENTGFEIYYNSFNLKAKRILDIIFALLIGVCVIPIMIVAAIIIKLESKGPIFFIQERIGEGNKPFKIVKFRSMTTDAEKDGPKWATKNDNRVTKFGKFMRLTRIDELPQLWNVLRGEMSFVGPRPEREFFIKQLEKEIMYYNLRHTVKPGLTGWAQVMYPYGASIEDAYRKLQYDLYYIKNHDILFDVKILLKTVTIVIFGKGR